MNEEKRFVCIDIGYGDGWYITDNGERLSEMEIVDLLNKQQDSIDALKEENDNCKNDYRELFSDYISLEEENKELEKGNEQLRKENFFLDYWKRKAMILLMQVRRLTPRMTDKEVIEFSKEIEK